MFKSKFSQLISTALLTLALTSAANAQDAPPTDPHAGWFPFVVPTLSDAQTSGSALDLSFLSPKPAGNDGFLRARGGQIVDGNGRVIQFFGTNITDYHAMPPKDKAPAIAKRLRELGHNYVRLHYFDWAPAPAGILNADMQTLNPEKLDQLDWLIYQLKQHGIYTDINLHVARGYPGLPEGWEWMGKGIDKIHPKFVASQKQYARDLLTHVNPYTKTAYTSEPAIAAIELNNENTGVNATGSNSLSVYYQLPEEVKAPVRALWNSWLRQKYGTTTKLLAAWEGDIPPDGPQLISNGNFAQGDKGWNIETGGGSAATKEIVAEGGANYIRWDATKAGTTEWNLQLHYGDVAVTHGTPTRLRFRARSSEPHDLMVRLMNQDTPWKDVFTSSTVKLTPQWQQFDVSGTIENPQRVPVRLSFDALNTPGTIEIADVSVRVGGQKLELPSNALEAGQVPLPGTVVNAQSKRDLALFATDRERQVTADLMNYLRKDLGVKAMLWDTQVNYGGAPGLLRESENSDVIDIHEYPAHPSGERLEGDNKWIWSIEQKSMLGKAFEALPGLAQWRVGGKPFTVSEFDLNPPNDAASETMPLLALMASYQSWNGFNEYAWFNFQGADFSYNPDRIWSPFATSGHAGQIAFMPAAALLFRQGLIAPAQTTRTLSVNRTDLRSGAVEWNAMADLWKSKGIGKGDAWRTKLNVQVVPSSPTTLTGAPLADSTDAAKFASDTGQIQFDRTTPGAETMTVNAPALRMAFGHTGGKSFDLGDAKISVLPGTRDGYANIMVTALDGLPLAQSKKVLVTAVARVENKGMKYNEARTSVGADFGEGPTLAEPVKFSVSVPGAGWSASALDGKGRKSGALKMNGTMLSVSEPSSLWYLLERA